MLEDLGRNPFGQGLYQWVFAPTVRLWRYREGKDDWRLRDYGNGVVLWVPEPVFEEYPAFPHIGPRWCLAIWQYIPRPEFERRFSRRTFWPPQGIYFPTDKIMKPGVAPTLDVTRYFMSCIRYSREKTLADHEAEIEALMDREDRESFCRMHDMILDACTAFGNDPGKRSGGVSFPSTEKERKNGDNREHLPETSSGGPSLVAH